ncbi:MAG: 3'-5' exonuclease [Chlorobiaceae bacterium]|jgi:DNA polymerase III subunit epsilon|nr:3'-5' exonuclease [Chlorobiaceae bacterium]NTV16986.1 3'-5' exonuclease [Chlorobiaceae bacterium]
MYLFFDTETTGLPRNWGASVTDIDNWPRLVQLAFILYDGDGNKKSEGDFIIKPEGFVIPSSAAQIHGITTDRAVLEGMPLREVLQSFQSLVAEAQVLVAHNISFDEKIVGSELIRAGMLNPLPSKIKICTMESATDFCALKGPYGNKWPKLSELYYQLFGTEFNEMHNAALDIEATAKCFWELKKRGVIS